jgi:hypothetical protein
MLTFATAEEATLDAFLSVSAGSPYQAELREYAESLLRQQCTRPSWCLLAFDSEVPVARAALWALPNEPVPSDIVLIDADWNDPDLADAHALLPHWARKGCNTTSTIRRERPSIKRTSPPESAS